MVGAVQQGDRGSEHADDDDGDVDIGLRPHGAHDRDQKALQRQREDNGECQARSACVTLTRRKADPPPMPSEKVLNAASVPRAMTRPFHRRRSVSSRSSMYPPASRLGRRRDRMRSRPVSAFVRADQAVNVTKILLVVEIVHEAAGKPPQQAVKRIPHRQTHQRLQEQTRQQTRAVVERAERPEPNVDVGGDGEQQCGVAEKKQARLSRFQGAHGDERQQEEQ